MTERNDLEDCLDVVGRNVQVSHAMKQHVLHKLKKLTDLTPPVISVEVYLEKRRAESLVEIHYKFSHFKVMCSAAHKKERTWLQRSKQNDMYQAIDVALTRLKAKLTKWKGRIQDHHNKDVKTETVEMRVYDQTVDVNDQIEEENQQKVDDLFDLPKVYKREKKVLAMLTEAEALMKMELSGDNFMVYRSEENQKLQSIYLRPDKTLGILTLE